MEIGEIISDALVYPFNNIKALIVYVILGVIAGIALGGTLVGIATGTQSHNALLTGFTGIIGTIISIIALLLIMGYELDIVKYGINRDPGAPGIDVVRQVVNAIKLLIVRIVYYIIPVIVGVILMLLLGRGILTLAIVFIVAIVFSLAAFMGTCRLAKTENLGDVLAIGEAIGDISRVGIGKLIITIIAIFVIIFVIALIIGLINNLNNVIGGILLGIFSVYAVFFAQRAIGLLYSDA